MTLDPSRLEEMMAKAQAVYEACIAVKKDVLGWEKIKERNGVVGYKRPNPETSFDTFKAECFIEKPPRVAGKYIWDNFPQLNMEMQSEDIESFTRKQSFGEDVGVFEVVFKGHGLLSGRDVDTFGVFLDLGSDTYAQIGLTCDTGRPPRPGYVRADLTGALNLYEPVGEDTSRTHVSYVMMLNPMGSVPAAIVNAILGRRTEIWEKFKERVDSL